MAELDIFANSLDDLMGNALAAEFPSVNDANTYYIITSNAKGGAASPFTGDTATVTQVTEAELQKIYQDSGQIQDTFGTFDNYMQYIVESQDWVKSADWMNATVEYDPTDREWLYQNNEDVMWKPGEREELRQKIASDLYNAKMNAWYAWLGEGKELMDKWGLNNTIYNNDGDQFRWTGSGYQKTIKVDDHADFGDYFGAVLKSVITGLVTGEIVSGIANVIGVADVIASLPPQIAEMIEGSQNANAIFGGIVNAVNAANKTGDDASKAAEDYIDQFGDTIITNLQGVVEDIYAGGGGIGVPEGYSVDENGTIFGPDGLPLPASHWVNWLYNLPDPASGGVKPTDPEDPENQDDSNGGGGGGGGGAADADNDGVPASEDPDDNDPNVPVDTSGVEADGGGAQAGDEYSWKYLGDGCFVKVDQNGNEVAGSEVCDPDYVAENYEFYKVGDLYGAGTDTPFGVPTGTGGDTTQPAPNPAAGTELGYECDPNTGDKIVFVADGNGGSTTKIIPGGCKEEADTGPITLGGTPEWGDDGGTSGDGTGGAEGGGATDAGTDGGTGTGEGAGDGSGEGTGEGTGTGGGSGAGEGEGTGDGDDGDGNGEVSLGGGMMGKPASFQGMMAGLSYEPQPIPGIKPTPQADYAADLEELIARQLQNRGMFT